MPELESPGPESADRLLGGRVRILQPPTGYRVAIDPVLLAAAVPAGAGDLVADLGSGTGAIALCLAARVPGCRVSGLEPDLANVARARESAALSGLVGRVTFAIGDLEQAAGLLGRDRFDHVAANPPYLPSASASAPADAHKQQATVEGAARLADWIATMLALARPGGTLSLSHRVDRLPELLALLAGRAGDCIVFPLWPRDGEAARRLLLRAAKGRRGPLKLAAGLVLHEAGGAYTKAAEAVLRGGQPLAL